MKKIFTLATAAFLFSGVAFAHEGKSCCKKEGEKKECCKKSTEKSCCKKDKKAESEKKKV